MSKKKYSVFISHSARDTAFARRVAKRIEKTGATVFLDVSNLEAGEPIAKAIGKALRESDEVVAVVTPNSGSSPWLGYELGLAVGLGKRIVPLLEKVAIRDLPSALSSFRAIKSDELDQYLAELNDRLKID